MRINTNIAALNSHRMLEKNTSISGRNLEKLSSGKRINRASDDAAGLAISEKMNAQIRGLKMASRNALDGVSLVQTAEGAMGEIHSMLQRMRELSVQAANGTMSPDDRRAIQDEINQLTSEVNRIGNGTEFNKLNILQGNQGPESNTIISKMSTGAPAEVSLDKIAVVAPPIFDKDLEFRHLDPTDTFSVVVNGKETIVNIQGFSTSTNLSYGDFLERINDALGDDAVAYFNDNGSILVKTNEAGGGQSVEFKGSTVTINKLFAVSGTEKAFGTAENPANKSEGTIFFSELPEKGSFITIGNTRIDFYDSSEEPYAGTNVPIDLNASADVEALVTNLISNLNIDGVTLSAVPGNAKTINIEADVVGFAGNVITLEGTLDEFNVNLQVGSNAGQGFRLEVGDTRSIALKISANKPTGNPGVAGAAYVEIPNVTNGIKPAFVEYSLDVMDESKATAAIEVFNNAIITVASERSKLGAIQNRLEKTIANLDNTAENLTAAKSRIEDTDMALEMSEFTKFNILQQAGTAMLSQANQQPQMMLKLLNA
ncbi:flagellin [Acetoanaerobium noterae]|uniref:flagellin N-terminal helical domain-containing protein n=1 Tax=Acetoanaerobium noterae TaxID=745369 RepID=UPI0028AE668B|nr:flagellin [Acetoanaerobium noterae]